MSPSRIVPPSASISARGASSTTWALSLVFAGLVVAALAVGISVVYPMLFSG